MCMHITAQQGLMHNTSDCKNKMLPWKLLVSTLSVHFILFRYIKIVLKITLNLHTSALDGFNWHSSCLTSRNIFSKTWIKLKAVLNIIWLTRFQCSQNLIRTSTAQKKKLSIKDFFSKFDQIRSFLRIWFYLLQK